MSDIIELVKKRDAILDHIYEYGTAAEGVAKLFFEYESAIRKDQIEKDAEICDTFYSIEGIAQLCSKEIRNQMVKQND